MKQLKTFMNIFEKSLITISMIVMVVLIFMQVFTRYVLGDAMTWSEEASRYIFIWMIFLSIGIGFTEKAHISIDMVKDRFSQKGQKILTQIVYIILLVVMIYFTYQGYLLTENMMNFGQKSATLQLPMWIVYVSLPVGFLFGSLRLVQSSIHLWTEEDSDNKPAEEEPIL